MAEMTPDTEEIREGYAWLDVRAEVAPEYGARFDRWLAAHDREIWDEAFEAGKRAAGD